MTDKTLSRSFAAGEISPLLLSRLDLDKFQTGLALCLNCETLPQGPIENRPGFEYVLAARKSATAVVLLPFSYNTQQTFALEFGDGYIRFHSNGGTLLEGTAGIANISSAATALLTTPGVNGYAVGDWLQVGTFAQPEWTAVLGNRWVKVGSVPSPTTFTITDLFDVPISTYALPAFVGATTTRRVYEVATPYAAADLSTLHYVQSADVMTIVSPLYEPKELRRLAATNWVLSSINFASTLAPPQSTGATPTAINHTYRVVGVAPSNGGYTGSSAATTCSNDITIPGRYNQVSWTSVPGGIMYFIYKLVGASWGLIGTAASGATFIDDGSVQPDLSAPQYLGLGPAPTASAVAVLPASLGLSVVPTGTGATVYTYAVTSVSSDGSEESIASGEVSTSNDLAIAGNFNTVKWPTVPGVLMYNVYRKASGIFGLVGRAGSDATFVDRNVLPDLATTPPIQINPFLGSGNYPAAVSYHQQRRVFGGTLNQPQNLWMTRSGTEKNLGYSFPSRDDDGITLRVVSREANTIRHIVPMGEMILLTSGGEWQVSAADTGALTPSNVSVKPQGYTGASNVQPVVTDRTILFAQDRGGAVRELQFSWQQQGYQTSNDSILAPHLFDYFTIKQMAFARSPLPALWSVRSDGTLLGMTYVIEHEVRAWHQHTTDGTFESVCTVAEGDEDAIYVVVRRTINGMPVRYIERRHTRRFDTPADQFFVDSGVTYSGTPASAVTGLFHLEGKTVSVLADGGVSPPQVVTNGSITIDAPASKINVGLPYVSRVKTLPISLQAQAFGQGTVKNVNKVHMRVHQSNDFEAGPSFDRLRPYPTRSTEPYGSAPDLVTGEVTITLDGNWQRDGAVCIQQAQPVAFTMLGMTVEVSVGS